MNKKELCEISVNLKEEIKQATEARSEPNDPLRIKVYHSDHAFEVLRRWLGGGPISQKDATQGLAEELHQLMDAHELGEMLNTSHFQDLVMDAIISLVIKSGHHFVIAKLAPPRAKGFPSKTSKLRQLLADWIAYGDFDSQRSNATQLPKDGDFNRLLAMTFVTRKITGFPTAPYMTNPCEYHVHRKMKPCPPSKVKQEMKE